MFQRDYLLRMIEELVQALGRVMKLHEQGQSDQAREELETSITTLTGMSLEAVLKMPAAAILSMMEAERAALLARFLVANGRMQSSVETRRTAFRKAFDMLDALDQRGALNEEEDQATMAAVVDELSSS